MNNHSQDNAQDGADSGKEKVGQWLQKTRMAARIDTNKICSDLKISPQVLEAIENGYYNKLPGDPYIRALLGSMARYLNLDPLAVVSAYNQEAGIAATVESVAPYKDKAHTYKTAHKQIFFVIVIALMIILFFMIGKLNKSESETADLPVAPPVADSLENYADTAAPESRALVPDSVIVPGAPAIKRDSLVPPPAPKPQSAAPVDTSTPDAQTGVTLKPLLDSVWVKVQRSGKPDYAALLRLGKQMQISHTDTIFVVYGKRGALEAVVGGKSSIPKKKRFLVLGQTVKTY